MIFERADGLVMGRGVHRSLPSFVAAGLVMLKGARLKRPNGDRCDSVWSNLVREAWPLRERQAGVRGPLIPSIKKNLPFHLHVGGAPWIHTGQVLSPQNDGGHTSPWAILK